MVSSFCQRPCFPFFECCNGAAAAANGAVAGSRFTDWWVIKGSRLTDWAAFSDVVGGFFLPGEAFTIVVPLGEDVAGIGWEEGSGVIDFRCCMRREGCVGSLAVESLFSFFRTFFGIATFAAADCFLPSCVGSSTLIVLLFSSSASL
jgi:hypothetical protein